MATTSPLSLAPEAAPAAPAAAEDLLPACCRLPDRRAVAGAAPGAGPGDEGPSWLRLGVAAVLAGQGMVFSLAYNLAHPPPAAFSAEYWALHGGLLLSAAVVLGVLGGPLARAVWTGLRRRTLGTEALFALSLGGALGASLTSTLTGAGPVFYEVVAIVLLIYALGALALARTRAGALEAVRREREAWAWAWVEDAGGARLRVPVAALRAGQAEVLAAPGEPLTVDGTVVTGAAFVRETALTGEPSPVAKGPGDAVFAGSTVLDGPLRVRVAAPAGQRRIDGVLAAVEQARLRPSELQEQALRWARRFTPAVAGTALLTWAGWWAAGAPWTTALFHAMAVLLVACPCALGLATPLAVWNGLEALSRLGLRARGGPFLDALARADTFFFDKTGTLSAEALEVAAWHPAPEWAGRLPELQRGVAALEAGQPHPIARALAPAAGGGAAAAGVVVEPARGLRALWPLAGAAAPAVEWRVGALGWMPESAQADFAALARRHPARRAVAVAVDGQAAALVELREPLRGRTAEVLRELAGLGLRVEILTGDPNPPWAEYAGAPVRVGLTPLQKAEAVRAAARAGGTVLFAGDGLNDAPAFAEAHGAVAMAAAAPLAAAAASATLEAATLEPLPRAVRIARRVRAGIRANLALAVGYNAAGMGLAAAGLLHPVAAALIMAVSSAAVGWRALRFAAE